MALCESVHVYLTVCFTVHHRVIIRSCLHKAPPVWHVYVPRSGCVHVSLREGADACDYGIANIFFVTITLPSVVHGRLYHARAKEDKDIHRISLWRCTEGIHSDAVPRWHGACLHGLLF